jgi:hypothetical protein
LYYVPEKEMKIHANRAKIFFTWLQTWAIITALLISWLGSSRSLDVWNRPLLSLLGLYYQHESEARLFNSEWRIVTYLNLQQASNNVDVIGKYLGATVDFCKKHDKTLWLNFTECRTTIFNATRQPEKLKGMRNLAYQLTRTEMSLVRRRRGILTLCGPAI